MRVAIIGANGNVGRRLGKILADKNHETVGFIRNQEQSADLETLGMKTQVADMMETSSEDYAELFKDMDAIVFTAGAGGKGVHLTKAIDGEGAEKVIKAAEDAGVNRFLMVSAFPDAGRDTVTKESFEFYMKMKRQADVVLANSNLNWAILRPGTLTNDKGNGNVTLGHAISYGDVSRDHVAQVLVALIENDDVSREILELTDGDTPVAEAVEQLKRS